SVQGHLETKERCLDGVRFASISRNNLALLLGRVRATTRPEQVQQTEQLLDHLVGACKQRRRHGEAEGAGGFEVDHQLELGRRLHRKISRLLAVEDAAHILSGTYIRFDRIWSVGHEPTTAREKPEGVDRR